MIQKCKVVYHNKFLNIIVFEFGDKKIQMTLDIPEGTKVVYIKYENKKYIVASEQEYRKSVAPVKIEKETLQPKMRNKK